MDTIENKIKALTDEQKKLLYKKISSKGAVTKQVKTIALSLEQKRMLFFQEFANCAAINNVPLAYKIIGKLKVDNLKKALRILCQRHDSLRTQIDFSNSQPSQTIQSSIALNFQILDYSQEPQDFKFFEKIIQSEATTPFNLAAAPLFRIKLIIISTEEYYLLITFHHIIFDGWSFGIFFKELNTIYSQLNADLPISLANLTSQYADYVGFQQQSLSQKQFNNYLEYWLKKLNNLPEVINLPFDYPRPQRLTYKGSAHVFCLSKSLSESLLTYAKTNNQTLYVTLMTVFIVMLYRLSGQSDLIIGTPVANRNKSNFENVIGLFINTTVIRVNVPEDIDFLSFNKLVRECCFESFSYQVLPFDYLIDHLKVERMVNINPVFQIMFALQNINDNNLLLSDLKVLPLPELSSADNNYALFDLNLIATQTPNGIRLNFNYPNDLFETETVKRFGEYFTTIAQLFMDHPYQKINSLNFLSNEEYNRIIYEWNRNDKLYPQNQLVHHLIENQAKLNPNQIYLIDEENNYSYRLINQKANQFARIFQTHGIQIGDIVAVALPRNAYTIISFLAILKCGAVYLYLDLNYPEDRLELMLNDAAAKLIIVDDSNKKLFSEYQGTKLLLPSLLNQANLSNDQNLNMLIPSHTMAYLIYTSGSTGKPKAVCVNHASIINYLYASAEIKSLSSVKCFLSPSSFAFDISVFDIYFSIFNGAKIIIPNDKSLKNPQTLIKLISEHAVEGFFATPTTLQMLVIADKSKLSNLVILCGGEVLHPSLAEYLCYQCDLYNVYGPTENTVISTIAKISNPKKITIGRPLNNIACYILDKNLMPVPIGCAGELYLSGRGLSMGYLNRPEITKKYFINNPFLENSLMYKTGDIVRYHSNGDIEYIGRSDNQVKIRGYRIELEEIERILLNCHNVANACVMVKTRDSDQKYLAAYIVSLNKSSANPLDNLIDDIMKVLRTKLPDYMIPATITVLEKFPLTISGKIDRKLLPEPEFQRLNFKDYQPPITQLQIQLAKIFANVLNLPKISIDDNFFSLGGDSILTLQFIQQAQIEGIYLPVSAIFEYPTIMTLANYLEKNSVLQEHASKTDLSKTIPLTPVQEFFFELNLKNIHHNNQSILLNCGNINPVNLQNAIYEVISMHQLLRVRYFKNENIWIQECLSIDEYSAQNFHLFQVIPIVATSEKTVTDWATEIHATLNIILGDLIRVVLFKLADGHNQLLIIVHHLVMDGISMRILIQDLFYIYNALEKKSKFNALPQTTSYYEWAKLLINLADSKVFLMEAKFWATQYAVAAAQIPLDFDYGPHTIASSCWIAVKLTEKQTSALLKNLKFSVNAVLTTALLLVLKEKFNKTNFCFATDLHGRELISKNIDLSRTIGWFTALFPLLIDIKNFDSIVSIVEHVQQCLEQVPHGGMGYGILKYLSKDSATEGVRKQAIPMVRFNYLGQWLDFSFNSDLNISIATESSGLTVDLDSIRPFLLDINAEVRERQLIIVWRYSNNHFYQHTIQGLADSYSRHLQTILTKLDNQIGVSSPRSNVILMNGTGQPVFCLHPVGGDIHNYWHLAKKMPKNIAFYGIKAESADYSDSTISIKQLAQKYLADIQRIQSSGPYYIMGWSFGALISFEIVHMLELQQESVTKLVMIDPSHSQGFNHVIGSPSRMLGLQKLFAEKPLMNFSLSEFLSFSLNQQLEFLINNSFVSDLDKQTQVEFMTMLRKHLMNINAMQSAEFSPIKSKTTIIFAEESIRDYNGEHNDIGWRGLCLGKYSSYRIQGDHYSILEQGRVDNLVKLIIDDDKSVMKIL